MHTTGEEFCCANVNRGTLLLFNILSIVEWSHPITSATFLADFKFKYFSIMSSISQLYNSTKRPPNVELYPLK